MVKYYFQIGKFEVIPAKIGFKRSWHPVEKPSKTYDTIDEVRAAARKYLITHKLESSYRAGYDATIYKNEKDIDSLVLHGKDEVGSVVHDKRVNNIGKLVPLPKWY